MEHPTFSPAATGSQGARAPPPLPLATIPGDIGIIGDLYQCARDLLQQRTTPSKISFATSSTQQRKLKRANQLLYLWGETHHVTEGTLDSTLQKSPRTQALVAKILGSILKQAVSVTFGRRSDDRTKAAEQLLDRARHVKPEKEETAAESSDEETSSESSDNEDLQDNERIGGALEQIIESIERLQDLDASLSALVDGVKHEKYLTATTPSHVVAIHESFSSMVRETFPKAAAELVEQLGRANFNRFRDVLVLRSQSVPSDQATDRQVGIASETKSRPQSSVNDSGYGSKETASQYIPIPLTPTMQDSSYASSIASSLSEGARSKYPILPEEAKTGQPFECAVCAKLVTARTKRQYRDHIKHDLNPYTCLIPGCTLPSKHCTTRVLWVGHMEKHLEADSTLWADFLCPLCGISMLGERFNLLAHIAKHLEEISLAVVPRDADADEDDSVETRTTNNTRATWIGLPSGFPSRSESFPSHRSEVSQSRAGRRSNLMSLLNPEPEVENKLEVDDKPEVEDEFSDSPPKRTTKHPATFQCSLCPKRFTRAYNLRSHLRSHTEERPYVCSVCGKAFARQHDRKRHESLHSGEKKFVCRGDLRDSGSWGCGRRFARADALGRHFRSEAGRVCIKPLLEEEANSKATSEQQAWDTTTFALPAAIIQQYPSLANIDWAAFPLVDNDDGYHADTFDDVTRRDPWGVTDEFAFDAAVWKQEPEPGYWQELNSELVDMPIENDLTDQPFVPYNNEDTPSAQPVVSQTVKQMPSTSELDRADIPNFKTNDFDQGKMAIPHDRPDVNHLPASTESIASDNMKEDLHSIQRRITDLFSRTGTTRSLGFSLRHELDSVVKALAAAKSKCFDASSHSDLSLEVREMFRPQIVHLVKQIAELFNAHAMFQQGLSLLDSQELSTKLSDTGPAAEDEDGYIIKCPCGFSEDDGNTVLCETCNTWQHIVCYYPAGNEAVPDDHFCLDCKPRPFNIEDARNRQVARRAPAPPRPRLSTHLFLDPLHTGLADFDNVEYSVLPAQGTNRIRRRVNAGGEHIKFRRTRNGCYTCRNRRVKCDETGPICERCRKGDRECIWPKPPFSDEDDATASAVEEPPWTKSARSQVASYEKMPKAESDPLPKRRGDWASSSRGHEQDSEKYINQHLPAKPSLSAVDRQSAPQAYRESPPSPTRYADFLTQEDADRFLKGLNDARRTTGDSVVDSADPISMDRGRFPVFDYTPLFDYTFTWNHQGAEEVFATGTFDDWRKTVKLDKLPDGTFEKVHTWRMTDSTKPVLYKFVVDGNWTVNRSLSNRTDPSGDVYNILNIL